MSKQVKLQVPIDSKIRNGLEKRASDLGFDSAQAYIRVWAKAEVEGRTLDFGDEWGEPSPSAAVRLNRLAKEAKQGKNITGPYNTVGEFMKELRRESS